MLASDTVTRKSLFNPARVAAFQSQLGNSTELYSFGNWDEEANEDAIFDAFPALSSLIYDDYAPHTRVRRLIGTERDAKLARCGSWYTYLSPAIGIRKPYQFRCKLKVCPVCGADRGLDLRFRLERAVLGNETSLIQRTEMPHDATRQFLRGLPKDALYLRLPQAGGRDVLYVISAVRHKGMTVVTKTDLATTDWTTLQNTPDGHLISGSVPRAKAEEETGGSTTTVLHMNFYQIPQEHTVVAHQCELLSIMDTFDLAPTGPTLQKAITTRQRAFEKHLLEAAVPHTSFPGQKKVKLCYIDWSTGITQSIDEMASYGLIRKDQLDTFLSTCTPAQTFEVLNGSAVRHLLET